MVQEDHIKVCNGDDQYKSESSLNKYIYSSRYVDVRFTPTIPHCSMATLIGLAIHVKVRKQKINDKYARLRSLTRINKYYAN